MYSKQEALSLITDLTVRFQDQFESYKKSDYNETLTRRDFIDPMFKALGWDIDNSQGYAEAYREVIHEDRVKIGKATKAPDYSFRLVGGKRLFFVEAKKPSVAVKEDIIPAYQVRRYGWSAKLPISIITDFEEFSVYDCTKKPNPNDKAGVARIKYLTFQNYLSEFDYIWETFSKERVLKGSFDKYISKDTQRKGTATVDKEFLDSLDEWRTVLANDVFKHNKLLGEEELNYFVQQTIDRLIFLRIAEDRSVESYGKLKESIKTGKFYQNLYHLFQQADDKYNSGLFDFKQDTLSRDIQLDNKVVKNIISQLYYPESPYEFSVLSVEILGNAYEQFLGKQIRINKDQKVTIEVKPEVRKAGGVYYTPQPIVDYIVNSTLGKSIDGKKPSDVSKIKIIDPACGSGSFLIGAYQYLLDWHKDYYTNKGKVSKGSKNSELTPDGNLTTSEKKRILLNNIFGVDLDRNAVEVTKLSLLLKCMEGETEASINTQLKLFNDRVLPTLDNNIKSGNSIADTDVYDLELDFNTDRSIRPLDFTSSFKDVFAKGGFDIVIGNPPWGAEITSELLGYIRKKYVTAQNGSPDTYALFIERAANLLKKNGTLGFIIPDTFLRKDDYSSLRSFLLLNHSISELIETGPVFSQVRDTWCSILILSNTKPSKTTTVSHKKISRFIVSVEERLSKFSKGDWDITTVTNQAIWQNKNERVIAYKASENEQKIIEKIESVRRLGVLSEYKISRGEEGSKLNVIESTNGDYQMVIPEDVKQFYTGKGKSVLSKTLTPGKITNIYSHPKLWVIRIQKMRWVKRIICSLDERTTSAGMKTLQSITSTTDDISSLLYLEAVLNSKLINFWSINYLSDDINGSYLGKVPVKVAESSGDKKTKSDIVDVTKRLRAAKKDRTQAKLTSQIEQLDTKIHFLLSKIDSLVYDLYDLQPHERSVVDNEPIVVQSMAGKTEDVVG